MNEINRTAWFIRVLFVPLEKLNSTKR